MTRFLRGRNITNHKSKMQWQLITSFEFWAGPYWTQLGLRGNEIEGVPFRGGRRREDLAVTLGGFCERECPKDNGFSDTCRKYGSVLHVEYALGHPFHSEVSLEYLWFTTILCIYSLLFELRFRTKGIFFNVKLVTYSHMYNISF